MVTAATKRRRKPTAKARKRRTDQVRASWSGMLRFGLVTFPVMAINAHAREQGAVAFHQLHKSCHRRIAYEKVCPVHGAVPHDEIVSGYEYRKGQYVEVEPEELDALRTQAEKALRIDTFIEPSDLDPIYFDGRMYYLAPQGQAAAEPYALLVEALRTTGLWGVGEVVFSGKDQVVLVRPYEGSLQMAMLNYAVEIRDPKEALGKTALAGVSGRNLALARQLVLGSRDDRFDFSQYKDRHLEKLRELIAAKVKGHEITAPEEPEPEAEVVSLMDALRKSVERAMASHNGPPRHNGDHHRRRGRGRRAS